MFSALLYLQFHTVKNRTWMRLKRLKQPKYLAGAIVGGLYFYYYFFRHLFMAPPPGGLPSFGTADNNRLFLEAAASLVLLIILAFAWILPSKRAALTFTEAEIAFLFPAPITRRGLIHYKLLRSQAAILFTVLLLTVVTNRAGGQAWIRAAGWWLVLSAIGLHTLGASFARTMLLERGVTNWRRRLWVLLALTALLVVTYAWVRRSLPPFDPAAITDSGAVRDYLQRALLSGPAYYILMPLRWLAGPYLASNAAEFVRALPFAAGILLVHYFWVVRANVAFEEASVEASRKLAETVAAVRAGKWGAGRSLPPAARRKTWTPFRLKPNGPPAAAFLWKNLISVGRGASLRLWIVILAVVVGAAVGFGSGAGMSNPARFFGMFAVMFLVWALFLGPQLMRQDFRQDLALADLLKTYPVPGWQMALGQILAPAVILSALQWLLLVAATLFLLPRQDVALGWPGNLGFSFGLALLLPFLNLVGLLIPNATVLLFPAWVQPGKDGPQGVEATGQRLIAMLGQVLVFALSLIVPALAFAIAFFLLRLLTPLPAAVLAGSVAAAVALAFEVAAAVAWLGRVFEKLDIAKELPA